MSDQSGVPSDDQLDGHTLEELSAYLQAHRTPRDQSIESSPACQTALRSLERVSALTWSAAEDESRADPGRDDRWITGMINSIRLELQSGDDIPLTPPAPRTTLVLTEGSVRGLLREVGDGVEGILVAKVALHGDVTVPDEPVSVELVVSAEYGYDLAALAEEVRQDVLLALGVHTELRVTAVDVVVQDVHTRREAEGEEDR